MKQRTILTALLLALALPATAQETKVPVLLRQQLDVAPTIIQITGAHRVSVILDTQSCILVQTYKESGDPAVEPMPEGQLQLSGDGRMLTVPRNYPYDIITIHTATSESLTVNVSGTANVTLQSALMDTTSLRSLRLTASSANLWVQTPLAVDDAVLTATNRGIISYSKMLVYHTMEENTQDGGAITCFDCEKRTINITSEGKVTTNEVPKEGVPVVRLMLNHDLPMFASLSVGVAGWSSTPFGGLMGSFGEMGGHRFRMGIHPTGYASLQYGVNLLTRSHWSLGVGLGFMEEHFSADNARIDIIGNHLLNADLSSYYSTSLAFINSYQAGDIVWRSNMRTNYFYIPLRAEWRLLSSYRGLRLSAQLMPGVTISRSKITLVREGAYPDRAGSENNSRIDIETTSVGRYVTPFRCDLRLDVGLSNVSLFVQAALTPLFRHQDYWLQVVLPNDQYDAINEKVYPMSIGCSINL